LSSPQQGQLLLPYIMGYNKYSYYVTLDVAVNCADWPICGWHMHATPSQWQRGWGVYVTLYVCCRIALRIIQRHQRLTSRHHYDLSTALINTAQPAVSSSIDQHADLQRFILHTSSTVDSEKSGC